MKQKTIYHFFNGTCNKLNLQQISQRTLAKKQLFNKITNFTKRKKYYKNIIQIIKAVKY